MVNENNIINMIDNFYNSPLIRLSDHCLLSFNSIQLLYWLSYNQKKKLLHGQNGRNQAQRGVKYKLESNTDGQDTDINTIWNKFEEKIS